MKKLLIAILGFVSLTSASFAVSIEVEDYFKSIKNEIYVTLSDKKISFEVKEKKLVKILKENFATLHAGRLVYGQGWRTLKKAQRKKYLKMFRKWIVTKYVNIFKNYKDRSDVIKSLKIVKSRDAGRQSIVYTSVNFTEKGNAPVKLMVNWFFVKKKGKYKLFDLSIDNVSLVSTTRSTISSIAKEKGFDGVMNKLSKDIKSMQSS